MLAFQSRNGFGALDILFVLAVFPGVNATAQDATALESTALESTALESTALDRSVSLTDASTSPVRFARPSLEWQTNDDSVSLVSGERIVWRFNHGTESTKHYFHPVGLVDGPSFTWDRPKDHPWHHGLWFSWKFLNGINYWEEDLATGRSQGRTSCSEPELITREDFSARIALNIAYSVPGGVTIMKGSRMIDVSAPDTDGGYHFDWSDRFTAQGTAVEIGRTPPPGQPSSKPWGGYAGLSVRFAEAIQDCKLATTDSTPVFNRGRFRGKSPAMDYSGTIDEQPVGITICDHPKNPGHPVSWYADALAKPMCFVSPAVVYEQPITLAAGESLELRYRVIIHRRRWTPKQVRKAQEVFLNSISGEWVPLAGDQ